MAESQNIEYKESWRDEYLKWVCGFANAQGGTIYIGIDDAGNVVGVQNVKKLLEDIPNKIQTVLGIVSDVNKKTKDGKDYVEIRVEPSSYPVNYHGEYHYRSGATKQQLKGFALTEFIRNKTGFLWDAVPVDNIGIEDLDQDSIEIFKREALRKQRMEKEDLDIPNDELMDHLDLLVDGKLKRAAVMLFYRKPGRIITGSYVKIGKFGEGSDLQYQDTVEGSLLETYPFPREGVREAIYNALGHNNYAASIPIQIRIEDDAMYISNNCILPKNWTVDTLMKPHKSEPFNPSIAHVFYRAGYIEAWGRGIQKICEACQELGTPDPEYKLLGDDITVKFFALESAKISESKNPKHQGDVLGDVLEDGILDELRRDSSLNQKELAEILGTSVPSIQRAMSRLKDNGRLIRKGGKRFGYWEVQ